MRRSQVIPLLAYMQSLKFNLLYDFDNEGSTVKNLGTFGTGGDLTHADTIAYGRGYTDYSAGYTTMSNDNSIKNNAMSFVFICAIDSNALDSARVMNWSTYAQLQHKTGTNELQWSHTMSGSDSLIKCAITTPVPFSAWFATFEGAVSGGIYRGYRGDLENVTTSVDAGVGTINTGSSNDLEFFNRTDGQRQLPVSKATVAGYINRVLSYREMQRITRLAGV